MWQELVLNCQRQPRHLSDVAPKKGVTTAQAGGATPRRRHAQPDPPAKRDSHPNGFGLHSGGAKLETIGKVWGYPNATCTHRYIQVGPNYPDRSNTTKERDCPYPHAAPLQHAAAQS